jgi:hypothetical protein
VSYGSEPRFPAEVGSGAITCHVAPDLTARLRWATVSPRVQRLWASLPFWDGLQHTHVSCGSGPRLPVGEGSDAATHHVVPNGSRASRIKKGIDGLPMQLGSHVSNECSRVSKVPDT